MHLRETANTRAKSREEQCQSSCLSHMQATAEHHETPLAATRARCDNLSAHVQVASVVTESIQTEATPEYAKA